MSYDRSNMQVLVVDHDDESLASLANILMAWQYKVRTAKDAHHALVTLRDSQVLFDLIISEFHIFGMNGFQFQKQIQDEFQLPVIVMSKDNRPDIISMSLEHGAAQYIVKPFCAEDFRDIWKYALEAKKNKLFIDSLFIASEEEEETSTDQLQTKKNCSKRKSCDDDQDQGEFGVVKKPRLVWTNNLHSRFLYAIRQIGMGDVVPKKILEIMNVPNLTRENVSSHLQKHRMFLKDVQEKGMEGGVSQRALSSKFASDLPISVINEIIERRKNSRYSNLSLFQAKNSFNDGASTSNSSNLSPFQAKNPFYDVASTSYPSYGVRKGMMASSSLSPSFLTRNLKFGDTSYRHHSIVGNDSFNHFNYGVKNWSVGSTIKNRSTEVGTGTTNKGRFDNVIPYSFGFNGVNVSENRGIHLHKSKAAVENATSVNKADFNNENNDASGFLNSDLFNFYQDVQPLEKASTSATGQASTSSTGQASTSSTDQEFDMDLIGDQEFDMDLIGELF